MKQDFFSRKINRFIKIVILSLIPFLQGIYFLDKLILYYITSYVGLYCQTYFTKPAR